MRMTINIVDKICRHPYETGAVKIGTDGNSVLRPEGET